MTLNPVIGGIQSSFSCVPRMALPAEVQYRGFPSSIRSYPHSVWDVQMVPRWACPGRLQDEDKTLLLSGRLACPKNVLL